MWSAQTILPIRENPAPLRELQAKFSSYGLGWFLRDYRGRKLVTHTGGAPGYVSRVMLVPEENLGVVVLTNAEEGGARRLDRVPRARSVLRAAALRLDRRIQGRPRRARRRKRPAPSRGRRRRA